MPRSELPDRPTQRSRISSNNNSPVLVYTNKPSGVLSNALRIPMCLPRTASVGGFGLIRIADVQRLRSQQPACCQFTIHLAEQMQITVVISHRQPATMGRYLAQLAPG